MSHEMLNSPKASLFANYITSMLALHGKLPADRISKMLKMTTPGGFDYSEDALITFLDKMVDLGKLGTKNGVYGVKKNKKISGNK